jgi:hypothetical protein
MCVHILAGVTVFVFLVVLGGRTEKNELRVNGRCMLTKGRFCNVNHHRGGSTVFICVQSRQRSAQCVILRAIPELTSITQLTNTSKLVFTTPTKSTVQIFLVPVGNRSPPSPPPPFGTNNGDTSCSPEATLKAKSFSSKKARIELMSRADMTTAPQ